MNTDKKLSPNFSLHEMLASQTATRKGFTEQFEPGPDVVENLKLLCNKVLEPVRMLNGNKPLRISSGYRCSRLNLAVGGVITSQHLSGQAADIDLGSKKDNKQLFDKIRKSKLVFDQLINEYDFAWVHVSITNHLNRKSVFAIG